MKEISIDNFTILLYLKNPTVFHGNNTIWYCCVFFIMLNFYINNIFSLKTPKLPYNQLGNNFLRSILGIFATRTSNILAMSKPNIIQYIKMVETLRRCQHIVICFPFSLVTAGSFQFSVENVGELVSAKKWNTVSVCPFPFLWQNNKI